MEQIKKDDLKLGMLIKYFDHRISKLHKRWYGVGVSKDNSERTGFVMEISDDKILVKGTGRFGSRFDYVLGNYTNITIKDVLSILPREV